MIQKKVGRAVGPDGVTRTPQAEQKINEVLFNTFRGEAADVALDYLRSISVQMVNGPDATDAQLRHREGMRDMMRIIQTRISYGEQYYRKQTEN